MAALEHIEVSKGQDRAELLRRLKESKILLPDEAERVADKHPGATGSDLARAFVDAGMLTKYQIDVIAAGKQAELRIGNYEVLDRLGAGGMGTVFKARHRRMKRLVALKVLAKNLSQDSSFVQRFQREVETIAQLSHPNIVMAYDADEAEVGHFLVMEFVEGQDLARMVQKQGRLSVRAAVECTLHAARGLECAHAQNIIHRDIKPANLLCDDSGTVKVTDLGLARCNPLSIPAGDDTANKSLTQAGGILGTADYMPPEQAIDSSTTDHRADIYSLGATLHFLLTGHGPYSAPSMMGILIKHREAPIPSLCAARQDVPADLDDLFRRMLAKDPRDRQQTMTEVVVALSAILKNLGAAAPSAVAGPSAAPIAERPTDASQDAAGTAVWGVAVSRGVKPHGSPVAMPAGPESMCSVLLVEPSRTQAGIIRRYLQAFDLMNIVSVTNGAEALNALATQSPDVILCAMHLNDMTGIQLAEQVRSERAAGPGKGPGFVLISSESEGPEASTFSQVAQAAILHKPFTADSLMQALKVVSRVFANLRALSSPVLAAPPRGAVKRDHWRVLIVDDSAAARLHERTVLAGLGLTQCTEAEDGAQAVALLAREKFELIVTDYNMPIMDGRGLVAYLKQNRATAVVPVIMVTTETDPSKLQSIRQLGVAAICDKSFPADAVRKIIDSL